MRLVIILILALALTAGLALFPEIAQEQMRIEAFGWMLEMTQGAFIVVGLLALCAIWIVQRFFAALLSGPGQLWRVLRSGSRKRREMTLREGIRKLIDMRQELTAKNLKKAQGVIPDWSLSLLRILATPAAEQEAPGTNKEALEIALAARIATDPHAKPKPDSVTRKAHLDAWLEASPGAPLAIARLPDVAEAEADWAALVRLLEDAWKKGDRAAASIKPRLAHAYLELARQQKREGSGDTIESLRKAHRLLPDSTEVLLALGKAYLAKNDDRAGRNLWLTHLEKHDDAVIAAACFDLLKSDAMRGYRKLEAESGLNPAQLWLRAQLAHAAKLTGLAHDHMTSLLEKHPSPLAWRTLGDWQVEESNWQEACRCYQQALTLDNDRKVD